MEFRENELATQAFCFLLNFIQEHNPDLVRRISIPLFDTSNTRVLLACHTLKQLNIIDDGDASVGQRQMPNSLTSIVNFLNKSCTQMGKRKLYEQITKPTFDETWLNREYQMIDLLLSANKTAVQMDIQTLRKSIHCVRDIDKMLRQIVIKKIYPNAIYNLYESVQTIGDISETLQQSDSDLLCKYLWPTNAEQNTNPKEYANHFKQFMNEHLNIDSCKSIASATIFDENIFKRGISDKLDQVYETNCNSIKIFNSFREYLNQIVSAVSNEKCTEYVKEHVTEKSGVSLQITKKRGAILKTAIVKICADPKHQYANLFTQLEFVSVNSTTFEISSPQINGLTKQMLYGKEQLNKILELTYKHFLTTLENTWYAKLDTLSKYIANLDVILTKTYLAKEYNYCRPEISESCEQKSFVDVQRLRHPLIEHIQKNELYVANDIAIGKDDVDGILLYGTNAVGKTSFIRSIGIAVIMAQSGMYVAASKFTYRPYRSMFSRILGNDDLFRGLSTFAVEMSELRVILKFADQYSMILGDELCSGTEIESALSIFMTGLMEFHKKRASFVFATHFHQIIGYSEMAECPRIRLKHMSVIYDREQDALIYDRILKNGPGTRMYGLEVCKSLHLDEHFLETAYQIRNKYADDGGGQLQNSSSTYNSNKIKGICEMCNRTLSEEVHHLSPQRSANIDGFIDTFHKNHPANLMALCSKCHDLEHKPTPVLTLNTNVDAASKLTVKKTVVKKKTTKGYIFQEK
jgi:DNA mismatch repair protein MutS